MESKPNIDSERMKAVMVGGGRAAVAVINSFSQLPSIELVGISDICSDAPGVVRARELGIPYYADMADLIEIPHVTMVIELTGVASVRQKIKQLIKTGQEVVSSRTMKIIFDMLDLIQEKTKSLQSGIKDNLNEVISHINNATLELKAKAELISEETLMVSGTAEKMSDNITAIATSSAQATNNVAKIAGSTEGLSATIEEIAHNTDKARDVTHSAVTSVQNASKRVTELGKSANEITKVTESIVFIADQTKLLALNATIEAARAGDAGKGFAVVASEVKELAKQTNTATADIRQKIEAIQDATQGTISEIGVITHVISDVNQIVSTIAAAVEEQSLSMRNMWTNVMEVAEGIKLMTDNFSQSSDMAKQVAKNISMVNANLDVMKDMTLKLGQASDVVEKASVKLQEMTEGKA
jgi:methyl-accepting chemotaxis protein